MCCRTRLPNSAAQSTSCRTLTSRRSSMTQTCAFSSEAQPAAVMLTYFSVVSDAIGDAMSGLAGQQRHGIKQGTGRPCFNDAAHIIWWQQGCTPAACACCLCAHALRCLQQHPAAVYLPVALTPLHAHNLDGPPSRLRTTTLSFYTAIPPADVTFLQAAFHGARPQSPGGMLHVSIS